MSASAGPGEPADGSAAAASTSPAAEAAAPDDPEQLRQEIDRTREELGETVAELAAKADVKARARDTAAGLAGRVKGQAGRVKGQVIQVRQDAVVGADIWRRQLTAKTAGGGHAAASRGGTAVGQVRSRAAAAGASVRQATPERVKQAAAQGAGQAKQHPGPLAAGAAAIVVGYLAFRALRRR
jgi:hypothetical protein